MERNITITLEKAREWYNSDNESLKELALQAFTKDELICNFKNITTFEKACEALGLNYDTMSSIAKKIAIVSKASAAMFKLNIVRKALNVGKELYFARNPKDSGFFYPFNPLTTKTSVYYRGELDSGRMEVIGKIKSEGKEYNVLNNSINYGSAAGLGCFYQYIGTCDADANVGFLGCASKDIAQHFGKYFGMLITEAKYADMVDFEIVENKYQ